MRPTRLGEFNLGYIQGVGLMEPEYEAYIDADILMYRAASFCESEFEGSPAADIGQARHFFEWMLSKWLKEAKEKVVISDWYLVYSVGGSFRRDLFPEYKSNRVDIQPWPGLRALKKSLMRDPRAVWEPGIEADDLVGIKVTEGPNRLAISADKDFLTVPCKLLVPASHGRAEGTWYDTSEDQANLNWLRQAITGDPVDNFKGIVGYGPVRAAEVLPDSAPVDAMWEATLKAFKHKGYSDDYAVTMARLARILRAGEYDFDRKEVKLWEPPIQSPLTTKMVA